MTPTGSSKKISWLLTCCQYMMRNMKCFPASVWHTDARPSFCSCYTPVCFGVLCLSFIYTEVFLLISSGICSLCFATKVSGISQYLVYNYTQNFYMATTSKSTSLVALIPSCYLTAKWQKKGLHSGFLMSSLVLYHKEMTEK